MFNLPFLTSRAVRTVKPALATSFTDAEIAMMADLGTIVHVSSGDELMRQGSEGTSAFVITNGTAAVHRDGEWIASLSKGDMVGEHSLATNQPRNATVTARMPITALRFDSEQFARLLAESPKLQRLSDELVAARN